MKLFNKNTVTFIDWTGLIIATLMILYALSFSYAVLSLDTSRDIFKAIQISQFTHWPLLGPDIGGFFHTGPIWFYFLALPAATGSLVFISFWVGLFAALKFLLAYLLGKALVNKHFGLLWAFMLLFPGWQVLNQFIISHTNLLETLSLALLLMLFYFYQQQKIRYWYFAALIMGLGFHAHPSFMVLAVFYVPLLWVSRTQLNYKMMIGAGLLFMFPLLPYIIDQMLHGHPDYIRFLERDVLTDQMKASGKAVLDQPHMIQHWWLNISSVVYGGSVRVLNFVSFHFSTIGYVMKIMFGIILLVIVVGLILLIKTNKHLKLFIWLIIGLMLALLLITLLRSFTPYYMLFSVTAIIHGIFAMAAFEVVKSHLSLYVVLLMMLLFIGFMPVFTLNFANNNAHINLGPVMNINQKPSDNWQNHEVALDALTVKESRDLSALFCAQSTTLNGPLTSVLDFTGGATLQLFCESNDVLLGGVHEDNKQAVFVMHKTFWNKTNLVPENWLSPSWGMIREYQNHTPTIGIAFKEFDDYIHPPRSLQSFGEYFDYNISISAPNSKYLVVSNILPANVQFKVNEVTANNQAVKLLVANATNRLYHCEHCQGQEINWQFTLTTNGLDVIDINTLNQ